MFEQIFGSKTRVKMMKIFLENPDKKFYVRQLTRMTDSMINSIRRELENLLDVGLIVIDESHIKNSIEEQKKGSIKEATDSLEQINDTAQSTEKTADKNDNFNKRKYYTLNKNNLFRNELSKLFAKGKLLIEKQFTDKIKTEGEIYYLALGGIFVHQKNASTDMLIIGNFQKDKIQKIIKQFEKEINKIINYTLMDVKEYSLRKDIGDRFLKSIIDGDQTLVVIDDLKQI